jgi:hypothetical protein
MKPHAEMHEGPEAFDRFLEAAKKLVSTPKSAIPIGQRLLEIE